VSRDRRLFFPSLYSARLQNKYSEMQKESPLETLLSEYFEDSGNFNETRESKVGSRGLKENDFPFFESDGDSMLILGQPIDDQIETKNIDSFAIPSKKASNNYGEDYSEDQIEESDYYDGDFESPEKSIEERMANVHLAEMSSLTFAQSNAESNSPELSPNQANHTGKPKKITKRRIKKKRQVSPKAPPNLSSSNNSNGNTNKISENVARNTYQHPQPDGQAPNSNSSNSYTHNTHYAPAARTHTASSSGAVSNAAAGGNGSSRGSSRMEDVAMGGDDEGYLGGGGGGYGKVILGGGGRDGAHSSDRSVEADGGVYRGGGGGGGSMPAGYNHYQQQQAHRTGSAGGAGGGSVGALGIGIGTSRDPDAELQLQKQGYRADSASRRQSDQRQPQYQQGQHQQQHFHQQQPSPQPTTSSAKGRYRLQHSLQGQQGQLPMLQKQLDTALKRVSLYRKENEMLQQRLDEAGINEAVERYKALLIQKEHYIVHLESENNSLKAVARNQAKHLAEKKKNPYGVSDSVVALNQEKQIEVLVTHARKSKEKMKQMQMFEQQIISENEHLHSQNGKLQRRNAKLKKQLLEAEEVAKHATEIQRHDRPHSVQILPSSSQQQQQHTSTHNGGDQAMDQMQVGIAEEGSVDSAATHLGIGENNSAFTQGSKYGIGAGGGAGGGGGSKVFTVSGTSKSKVGQYRHLLEEKDAELEKLRQAMASHEKSVLTRQSRLEKDNGLLKSQVDQLAEEIKRLEAELDKRELFGRTQVFGTSMMRIIVISTPGSCCCCSVLDPILSLCLVAYVHV
jgi:hypothetical protein